METPIGMVRACMEAVPRLRATEALEAALRVSVGTGSLTVDDQRAVRREWLTASRPAHRRARPLPPSARDLGEIGIAVKRVRKKQADG